MRKLLLCITILISLGSQSQAQISTKKEKIKDLFSLMHQDSLIIKSFDAMTSSMVKSMSAMFNDTTYASHGIDVSKITQKLLEKNMKRSKENALKLLNEDLVDIYDQYFTLEEINDFTVFYKSKSGQRLLITMPDITKDVMTIMSVKYQKDAQQSFMKDIEEITNDITEQMKKQQR